MATNLPKNNRPDYVASIEKLVEGFIKNAAAVPQLVLGGTTVTNADIVIRLNARIAQAKAVAPANSAWRAAVEADNAATQNIKPFLSAIRQALLVVLAGKTATLGDFGLAARKPPTETPAKRAAAALKAKATRAARGTMGKKQKAQIVANVAVTPATAVPVKSVPADGAPTATPAAAATTTPTTTTTPTATTTAATTTTPTPTTTPAPTAATPPTPHA